MQLLKLFLESEKYKDVCNGRNLYVIDRTVSHSKRARILKEMNADPRAIALLSTPTCSTGLNLQSFYTLYLLERL